MSKVSNTGVQPMQLYCVICKLQHLKCKSKLKFKIYIYSSINTQISLKVVICITCAYNKSGQKIEKIICLAFAPSNTARKNILLLLNKFWIIFKWWKNNMLYFKQALIKKENKTNSASADRYHNKHIFSVL